MSSILLYYTSLPQTPVIKYSYVDCGNANISNKGGRTWIRYIPRDLLSSEQRIIVKNGSKGFFYCLHTFFRFTGQGSCDSGFVIINIR